MNNFEHELSLRLEEIRRRELYRELRQVDSPQGTIVRINGRPLLNFASNDYLGMANEPAVKSAALAALERYGAGSGASRLLCGSLRPFHHLEEALTAFKGVEATVSFSSGYAAAQGVICALIGRNDILILDKLSHACLVDAARLSGATLRVFAHNDPDDLERILKWSDQRETVGASKTKPLVLIVTESVFSMDGDLAPLSEIVKLKEKYGAWLMVDEAHATGLYGKHGRGLADHFRVADQIEIQMGTLGKALGAAGGYICGSRRLIDFLVNSARSFIFSTAPVPSSAAAAAAALELVQGAEGEARREHLRSLSVVACTALEECGAGAWNKPQRTTPAQNGLWAAILPVVLGHETVALSTAASLNRMGLFVPAIRYPTVARGAARLRISLSAAHTQENLATLLASLQAALASQIPVSRT